jgi:predicted porin
MKKKLVAVAVAGVLGAPLAAHAQTANVTLYGRLNVDFEVVNGRQPDGTNPTVTRLSSNSSRFGMRGTEALGGGLNAIRTPATSVDAKRSSGSRAAGARSRWATS